MLCTGKVNHSSIYLIIILNIILNKILAKNCYEIFNTQQALRQIAFRQIHKVLGMEPLPRFQKKQLQNTRKRRRDNNEVCEGEETDVSNDLKKDKKEENINSMELDANAVKAEPST